MALLTEKRRRSLSDAAPFLVMPRYWKPARRQNSDDALRHHFVLRYATLSETAMHYLKYMLLINTYYVMGAAVNTTLIAGVFRALRSSPLNGNIA